MRPLWDSSFKRKRNEAKVFRERQTVDWEIQQGVKNMRQKLMRCTFATEQEYRSKREEIHQCIEQALQTFSREELTMIEIAINEAVNNAFKYGSIGKTELAVMISIFLLQPNYLLIRIKDAGNGFCAERLLARTENVCENDQEWQWGESGRGLFIMEAVMDQVRYNAKGNAVSLLKSI